MADERILSVGELNEYLKLSIESDPALRGVGVAGEISNFKRHSSGHLYFSLKDQTGLIRCVQFRSDAAKLKFMPTDGMRVVAKGTVSVYTRDGQLQLYVRSLAEAGAGNLYLAFERLKNRLQQEGLFDPAQKKRLPPHPQKIALVTSPTGAVIRDLIQVSRRRNKGVALMLCPVKVQGEGAALTIAQMIRRLQSRADIDLIILGRGGGSLEDLWAFNEEIVARAIADSRIPIISAVGHETDFTIADFAADVRAATPSAAAEIAVPRSDALREMIDARIRRAKAAYAARIQQRWTVLFAVMRRLERQRPEMRLRERRLMLDHAVERTESLAAAAIKARNEGLIRRVERLEALNPLRVLKRGFVLMRDKQGGLLSGVGHLRPDMPVGIILKDGRAVARILSTQEGYENG